MKKSDALAKALAESLAEEERLEQEFGDDQEEGAVIAFKVRLARAQHPSYRGTGINTPVRRN